MSDDLILRRAGTIGPAPHAEPDADDKGGPSDGDADNDLNVTALVGRINALDPAPPKPLAAGDVRIYCALVANDQIDSYGTQFTVNALDQIARGIVGMPALRNHQGYVSSDMPVARWFYGDVIQVDGVNWARCWAYSSANPADTESAMLDARIAIGVLREVSLSWYQDTMKCSICGQDMWGSDCPHIPLEVYEGRVCAGVMEQIREVVEASLVWKGGQYGTSIAPVGRGDDVSRGTSGEREPEGRSTLQQRIAVKRCAKPASAGESDLDWWLQEAAEHARMAIPTPFLSKPIEDIFKAG